MIIKITKSGFVPAAKTVRFGYSNEEYTDLFENAEHDVHFYPAGNPNEYLVCLNEVRRDSKIGTLLVLDMKKLGNQKLLKQALESDYGLSESEYEITFI